jgi:transposase
MEVLCLQKDENPTMGSKHFDEEFRRRSVDLYESTPGATVKTIAGDLGISESALWRWIRQYGTGAKTSATGRKGDPIKTQETLEQRVARLELELAHERAEMRKLQTEKEILRAAAKYFAGETNW